MYPAFSLKNKSFLKIIAFIFLSPVIPTYAQVKMSDYQIKGELKGLHDSSFLYLLRNGDRGGGIDTVSITQSEGDCFSFVGQLALEGEAYFIFLDTLDAAYKHLRRKYLLLHLENSTINIHGSIDSLGPYDIMISGSKVHDDLMDYQFGFKHRFIDKDEYAELKRAEVKLIRSEDSSAEAMERLASLRKEIDFVKTKPSLFKSEWIQSHLNSLITPWLLISTEDSLQDLYYPKLSVPIQNSYYGIQLKELMLRNKRLAIGAQAPELNLLTEGGDSLALYDIVRRHKLTIVDFWAYWCKPCRVGFSKLRELYGKYKEKGLAIYGVSVDGEVEPWLKALSEEDLPWYNVIVSDEGKNTVANKLYGVSAVPAYFLLDQNGSILLKWSGKPSPELEDYLYRLE